MFLGNHFLNGFVGCIYSLDISNRYVGLPDADGGEEENDNSNQKSWHGSLKEILEVKIFLFAFLKSNKTDFFRYNFSSNVPFYLSNKKSLDHEHKGMSVFQNGDVCIPRKRPEAPVRSTIPTTTRTTTTTTVRYLLILGNIHFFS